MAERSSTTAYATLSGPLADPKKERENDMKKQTISIVLLLLGLVLAACAYAEVPDDQNAARATFAVQ